MDVFKEIVKELSPLFKKLGFNKKGNSFYFETEENVGVINLQKSKELIGEACKFTINFGVYSDTIGRMLDNNYSKLTKPDIDQCHWQSRVGSFMDGSPDFWWLVNNFDDFDSITLKVVDVVNRIVVPELKRRMSDEGLINNWMNEGYAGTTEIGRFKYLTSLLKAKGDLETLRLVVETFIQQTKGKPNAVRAIEHLKELKYSI